MKFNQAMYLLKKGKKIRRKTWNNPDYFVIKGKIYEFCVISESGKTEIDFNFKMEDFEATDWEIYKEIDLQDVMKYIGWEKAHQTEKALKILKEVGINPENCFFDEDYKVFIPCDEIIKLKKYQK